MFKQLKFLQFKVFCTAIDISKEAIELSKENCARLVKHTSLDWHFVCSHRLPANFCQYFYLLKSHKSFYFQTRFICTSHISQSFTW